MKRRLFAGLIASAMMASMLAGCGGSSGSNGNAQGGDKASGDGYSMTLIMSLRDGRTERYRQDAPVYRIC